MAMKDISDRQVCVAYEAAARLRDVPGRAEAVWPYHLLEQWTGQPFKVCYRAMERACRRDFVDYGVSLRAGYLTPKGRQLLDNADFSPAAPSRPVGIMGVCDDV